MICRFALVLIAIACAINARGQFIIRLYEDTIPGSLASVDQEVVVSATEYDTVISKVSVPSLTAYLPSGDHVSGSAVIICPGGGYQVLCLYREGHKIAKAFCDIGIAAFVLKYRLPDENIMTNKSIGPLQDAQRAIQVVRLNAGKWHLDNDKIGIMGFSAGGHLAATAGTHFGSEFIENKMGTSLRPDFMILIYPVISFKDSIGHIGSRSNLLGNSPPAKLIDQFSNEEHVSLLTPPAFITHASDDKVVSVNNSLMMYDALIRNSVPAEMHIYSSGGHGYSLNPPFDEWFGRCSYWLKSNGWLQGSNGND